ncbi:MAG: hypothetical protein IPN29_15260 [Saprospiraceae bacterium]|nr:hypothetical protein [Saprospiraceae bacterium]
MWKYLLALLMLCHGLIHLMGFVKAYRFARLEKLNLEISRPLGLLCLLAALTFALAVFLMLRDKEFWIVLAIAAIFISQLLIFYSWIDAKWGSLANVLIAIVVILASGFSRFHKVFANDARNGLSAKQAMSEIVTENDLSLLPLPVRQYLKYCGVVGKPLTRNVRVEFEGEMRDKGKNWFPFRSVQYNFYPENTRLFFMTAKMFGMTVPGYHRFVAGKASMDIRLFGLIPVVRHTGAEMDVSETVTIFNDMCLLSPSSLLEANVQWQLVDELTVRPSLQTGAFQSLRCYGLIKKGS